MRKFLSCLTAVAVVMLAVASSHAASVGLLSDWTFDNTNVNAVTGGTGSLAGIATFGTTEVQKEVQKGTFYFIGYSASHVAQFLN